MTTTPQERNERHTLRAYHESLTEALALASSEVINAMMTIYAFCEDMESLEDTYGLLGIKDPDFGERIVEVRSSVATLSKALEGLGFSQETGSKRIEFRAGAAVYINNVVESMLTAIVEHETMRIAEQVGALESIMTMLEILDREDLAYYTFSVLVEMIEIGCKTMGGSEEA